MGTALHTARDYLAEAQRLGEPVRHDTMDRYTTPSGAVLPSVTFVLRQTEPAEDRERLDRWRARVGDAEAQRRSEAGARRGTAMHLAVQTALERNGCRMPLSFKRADHDDVDPELDSPHGRSIMPVVRRVAAATWIETVVHCETLGVVGTADLLGVVDGIDTCVDWTSKDHPKGRKLTRSAVSKYTRDKRLQVAAYARLAGMCGKFNPDRGLVVVGAPDVDAFVFSVDIASEFERFLDRLHEFEKLAAQGKIAGWP